MGGHYPNNSINSSTKFNNKIINLVRAVDDYIETETAQQEFCKYIQYERNT